MPDQYEQYFEKCKKVTPYLTQQELLEDIFCLVDLFLHMAFLLKEDLNEPEMRGIVVTPYEWEYALHSRRIESILQREEKLKESGVREELEAAWNHVESRIFLTSSPDDWNRILWIIKKYGSDPLERWCFYLCLVLEYDRKYERLYAYLQDNVDEKCPSVGLAVATYSLLAGQTPELPSNKSPLFLELLKHQSEESILSHLGYPMLLCSEAVSFIRFGTRFNPLLIQEGRFAFWVPLLYQRSDLICNPQQEKLLNQLVSRIRYRDDVEIKWNFGKKYTCGNGISAIFHGAPGTGKTMAAQVIARELGMELYKVDVSSILSKYIGETEKNLNQIFQSVEGRKVILLFDEADGLFAKRSEIQTSIDRYANTETGYLLQRFEEFGGVSIMTTNYMRNLDHAFRRRFTFIVAFEEPDQNARLHLWQKAIPDSLPLEESIDFNYYAEQLKITGSHIREIVTNGVYIAAERKTGLNNSIICEAISMLYEKYNWVSIHLKYEDT